MRVIIFSLITLITLIAPLSLVAKKNTAVLRLCFQEDEKPFFIATQKKAEANEKGFIPYKDGITYMMKMRVYVDGTPHPYFKPYNESCISIFRVPAGKHVVTARFRTVNYTTLYILGNYSKKFRANLLYETVFQVTSTDIAHITIKQTSNKVQLYESITNSPIPNCEKSCDIPADIPIYFKERADNQKIPCPADYRLTVKSEKEKDLPCYSDKKIREVITEYVKKENIECKPDIEKAHFQLFGEGCLISFESNRDGLHYLPPTMQIIPATERKFHYFLTIDKKTKSYKFNEAKTGKKITPEVNQQIVFTEKRKSKK